MDPVPPVPRPLVIHTKAGIQNLQFAVDSRLRRSDALRIISDSLLDKKIGKGDNHDGKEPAVKIHGTLPPSLHAF